MSRRPWVVVVGILALFALTACSDDVQEPGGGWTGVCIDVDGDGYGLQCAAGDDCDDTNSSVHAGCNACARPSEGCSCDPGTAPVDCQGKSEVTSGGALLCKEGTRYCRDGRWSGCEGISSFEAPAPEKLLGLKAQALLAADAAVVCSYCTPDCYDIEDPIRGAGDAGTGMDSSIAYTGNGSITLNGGGTDAGRDPDQVDPEPPCNMLLDSDCDGVPNLLDPYPTDKPFESDHQTIFMNLAAGESGSNTFDLKFYLKTADLYFLLDMTGSMADEKNNLFNSLKTGNFLDDPSTLGVDESQAVECADINFDGTPDNQLKTRGLSGNIACLIRSAGLGTGLYREIPFNSVDSYGLAYAGAPDLEGYEHRLDITTGEAAVDAVASSLTTFYTRGNRNNAESGGVALYSVATGGPVYMGWDRPGIPPRVCPAGRFGYPCFRNDAMPIVVLITDAPLMNGPTPAQGHLGQTNMATGNNKYNAQPVNYDARGLAYQWNGSDQTYTPVAGNDEYATAYTIPNVHTTFKTYTGDTRTLAGNYNQSNLPMTCSHFPTTSSATVNYPDAVFKFTSTDANSKISISTRGSRFKPAIAVFPTNMQNLSVTDNPLLALARNLGPITATSMVTLRGDTSGLTFATGELLNTTLGSTCIAGKTIFATAPDAYYTFTVPTAVNGVRFAIDGGTYDPFLVLFEGTTPTSGSRVGCVLETSSVKSFNADLKANTTYTLVMRGQQTGNGPHTITITGPSHVSTCAYNNAVYSEKFNPDDPEYATGNADIVDQTFPPGDYYIVLKGRAEIETEISDQLAVDVRGRGWYQLTIGDRTKGNAYTTASMPVWGTAASGTMKELLDRGIRVIVAASAKPKSGYAGSAANAVTALQQQADIISQTTKAISGTQTTRDFDFYNDGSGIGFSIVNAVAKLTNNVAMDVTVRLVPLPETPSKPFGFTARAIDVAGDLCGPPVDTNGDNVKDTHKGCTPGATPRFEITIKNPAAPNNVPPNPVLNSKGGYNMRVEMIADGKYVIDQTPVFVIPEAVLPKPPVFQFDQSGTYAQDVVAGCEGTDRPTWQQLAWNDTLPTGTSLVWKVCAGDTSAELDACITANKAVTIATVTQQDGCSNCAGYCATGVCHIPTAPTGTCSLPLGLNEAQCGLEGTANTPGTCGVTGACSWKSNPISVLPALRGGLNGKKMLRVQVVLNASTDRQRAPVVHDFKVRYVCSPGV